MDNNNNNKNFTETLTKYPREITGVVRTQTLAINGKLQRAIATNNECPYSVYGTYSRIKFGLIDSGKSVTSSVRIPELADIFARSEFIVNKSYEYEINNTNNTDTSALSPAYTVKITSGKHKGKTPAEILLSGDPNATADLNQQYKFLKENLAKYPNNKYQMDAIKDAANLNSEGKLDNNSVTKAIIFPIYKGSMRPNIYKKNENGKCFVYELKIDCFLGENYPIRVEIANYYAPVVQDEVTKLLNVKAKQTEDLVKHTMQLSVAEWLNMVRAIKTHMAQFEQLNAVAIFKDADNADKFSQNGNN